MLSGGTEEGTEEIAEGVPGQEVRHAGWEKGGLRVMRLLWIYIFGIHPGMGPQMHGDWLGLLLGSSRLTRRDEGPGEHC